MKENGKKFILCRALGSVDDAASGLRCFTWTERLHVVNQGTLAPTAHPLARFDVGIEKPDALHRQRQRRIDAHDAYGLP